ncbi:ABC-type transport system permease [Dasineura jujubifolia toursvirus 2a]|nr:ABC-type transport system permease [Dasineura jujubifolia toursvirus 2a]
MLEFETKPDLLTDSDTVSVMTNSPALDISNVLDTTNSSEEETDNNYINRIKKPIKRVKKKQVYSEYKKPIEYNNDVNGILNETMNYPEDDNDDLYRLPYKNNTNNVYIDPPTNCDDVCEDDIQDYNNYNTKNHTIFNQKSKNILDRILHTNSDKNDTTEDEDELCDSECEAHKRILKLHPEYNDKHLYKEFPFEVYNKKEDKYLERIFYYSYRARQKLSGSIWGCLELGLTGYYIGMKWGGGGGWIAGGIAQLVGMVFPPIIGGIVGLVGGIIVDKPVIANITKDYRYSIGAGGIPPTHGTLS